MTDIFTMLLAILGVSSVVIFHELRHFFSMPINSFSIGLKYYSVRFRVLSVALSLLYLKKLICMREE